MDFRHTVPSEAALRLLNVRFSGRCMIPKLRDIRWLGAPPEYLELMLPLIVSPLLTNFRLRLGTYGGSKASQVVPTLETLAPAYNSTLRSASVPIPSTILKLSTRLPISCSNVIRTQSVISGWLLPYPQRLSFTPRNLQTWSRLLSGRVRSSSACHLPTTVFSSLKFLEIDAIGTCSPLLKTIAYIQSRTFTELELKFPATTLEMFLPTTLVTL